MTNHSLQTSGINYNVPGAVFKQKNLLALTTSTMTLVRGNVTKQMQCNLMVQLNLTNLHACGSD